MRREKMETEIETIEAEPVVFITTLPDIQVGLEAETGRSNWQNVSSQGRLCRKRQWRWYGCFDPGNVRPLARRHWRSLG
jgi:hypothetical protein